MRGRIIKIFVYFLLISIFGSCSILEPGEDNLYIESWASVKKIEVNKNSNGRIEFTVLLGIPTPCTIYGRREIKISGDTLFVTYYSKYKKDEFCIQVLASTKIKDTFILESNKDFLFKFWQLGGTYLDTLIHIN